MKALSLTQPWASMVAWGEKRIETRSWSTKHRGLVAIHAAKGWPTTARAFAQTNRYVLAALRARIADGRIMMADEIPLGAIVAVCRVVDVQLTQALVDGLTDQERALGNYEPGRYGWRLDDIIELPVPIPCKGSLGLWTVPAQIAEAVSIAQLVGHHR